MIARTSSTAWVRGVVDMFVAEGLDARGLFSAAGLDIAVLDDPAGRLSIDDVSLLWELAVARSGNGTLGLSRTLAARHGNLGVVRYAMMACPTLGEALQRLVRYMNVVSNAATFAMTPAEGGWWFELGHQGGERPVPRQRVEFGMLTVLTSCSWFTGRELQARAVEFVHPEPPDRRPHEQAFGCPLRFGQPCNRALLRDADLALPLTARDPALASMLGRLVEDELERLDGARTGARVRRILQAQPGQPEPRREQVAAALHLSDRTLQRRLHEEGTSFQRLLDDTRRERAQWLLRQPQTSLKRAAELLGFEDQSNLVRACRRWFGMSPGQYRSRFCAAGLPPVARVTGHAGDVARPGRPPG